MITFDKGDNTSSSIKKTVTFESATQDIKDAQKLHSINNAIANALVAILSNAQKQSNKHPDITAKLLDGGINILNVSQTHSILITQEIYAILIEDFTDLKNSL